MRRTSSVRIVSLAIACTSSFLLFACDSTPGRTPRKNENKIVAYKIAKPAKTEPSDIRRRDSTETQLPTKKKFKFTSAKKAFESFKKYRGAEDVLRSLPAKSMAVVSSSQALESLKPAMWWGVFLHGGGGVYADATVSASPGDFWNVDIVFNCSNVFKEPSMTQEYERVCFSSANNTNDIYYGLSSPSFSTGGPNGVMQFEFRTSTSDTFLGVFTMYGYSENVDLYVNETLVATYNVSFYDREYSFMVDLPAGTHRVTAIYRSTSSDKSYAYLTYEQFVLYRL